ncbi:hypothetical protein GQ42DRAFT_161988 [Ramicandelaber brevisporus]|nr:hypothetical protein GQ42DRAFT_161988 [Ramicandelaber brevisporus]
MSKSTVMTGVYRAEEWIEQDKKFVENPAVGIQITVLEIPTNSLLVNTRGQHIGKFVFTALEAGQHQICLQGNSTHWFNPTTIKMSLEVAYGDANEQTKDHETKLGDMGMRVYELNRKVDEIKTEQNYQRDREIEFRNLSENINGRIVYWTFMQIAVIGVVCFWQVRHLRSFFQAKKLV